MDILGKYQQEHPDASPQKIEWGPSNDYGFFTRLVMKLSRGKIQDERQANFVLLAVVGIVFLITAVIVIRIISGGGPDITEKDLQLTPPSSTDQQ